jgi:hypothetical protein
LSAKKLQITDKLCEFEEERLCSEIDEFEDSEVLIERNPSQVRLPQSFHGNLMNMKY